MVNHLLSITNDLYSYAVDNAQKNGRRMSSILTILCSLYAIIPKYAKMEKIPYSCISQLLSMLRLMPDVDKRECVDYDYLIQLIPGRFRKVARESLIGFILHLSHTKLFRVPQWLYSIPLGHFLYEASKPFEGFNLDPKKIQFEDKYLGFKHIKSETSDKNHKYVYMMLCCNYCV